MPDHATLSASQGPLIRSSNNTLKDTEQTPIVVSDLSASIGNWSKTSLSLREATHDHMEIASSIALAKISAAGYSWQEARRLFLFVSRLGLLMQRYSLRERDEILRLLEKYPPLSLLLLEIHGRIAPYFPNAQFFLQAVTNPASTDDLETSDDNENLVISVVTHIRPREALDRLKQFYMDWWLQTPNRTKLKEKISFNLECV